MPGSPFQGIISLYELILFTRIILTWVPHDSSHPASKFLYQITEPLLEPARKVVPPLGGLDLSPMAVLLGLEFIKRILI